jgi:hypothetical protein
VTFAEQSTVQFAIVTICGAATCTWSGVLITDYRGHLTSYTRRTWKAWQRPLLQKWSRYPDETSVRKQTRRFAMLGALVGSLILILELTALATGHIN